MSEERTRFPIQPQEIRRSAASSDDVAEAPEQLPPEDPVKRRAFEQDKPARPPQERHGPDGAAGRGEDRD